MKLSENINLKLKEHVCMAKERESVIGIVTKSGEDQRRRIRRVNVLGCFTVRTDMLPSSVPRS